MCKGRKRVARLPGRSVVQVRPTCAMAEAFGLLALTRLTTTSWPAVSCYARQGVVCEHDTCAMKISSSGNS
jgi:hypothetical protein